MKTKNLFIFAAICLVMSSCSVLNDFCTTVSDNADQYIREQLNSGKLNTNMSDKERMDLWKGFARNTREARSWEGGIASRTLLGLSTGVSVAAELSGKDFSLAKEILDKTMDDLAADKGYQGSTAMNFLGAALYGASNVIEHYENERTNEYNAYIENWMNEQEKYDKYVRCRYKISDKTGRYYDVKKYDGMKAVIECIRAQDENEYYMQLQEGLDICYPGLTVAKLEEMFKDSSRRFEVMDIKIEALKCYEKAQKEAESIQSDFDEKYSRDGISNNENEYVFMEEMPIEYQSMTLDEAINTIQTVKLNKFRFDNTDLNESMRRSLNTIFILMKKYPEIQVTFIGHTCDIGYRSVNKKKGLERAAKAKEYLVERGIDESKICIQSKGESCPLVPNTNGVNRAKNRRIEIVVKK